MESFMRRGRQWRRVLSVLFALLALARATQQSEVESDLLRYSRGIYAGGPFKVHLLTVPSIANDPPRLLLIAAPEAPREYPVVQFQHGLNLQNDYYSQLLTHVASYGFIAVAPQMARSKLVMDAKGEICQAAFVTDWLQTGLNKTLPRSVKPELDKLAVVGHGRGGKVVFGLATHVCSTSLNFSAIVGLDPVDGSTELQTMPPILKFSPHDLKLGIPTLIVGGGLSSDGRQLFDYPGCQQPPVIPLCPCGPKPYSHQQFFDESDAPAFHFVAPNYGHMDFLNDNCGPEDVFKTQCFCVNGPNRADMCTFSAGITAAFLQAYLNKEVSPFHDAIKHYGLAPVILEKPEIYGHLPVLDFLDAQKT